MLTLIDTITAPAADAPSRRPEPTVVPSSVGGGALVVATCPIPCCPDWRGTLITPTGYPLDEGGHEVVPVWAPELREALVAVGWVVAEWGWHTGCDASPWRHPAGGICPECRVTPSGIWISGSAMPRALAILADLGVRSTVDVDAEDRAPLSSAHVMSLHGVGDDGTAWDALDAAGLTAPCDDWDVIPVVITCDADVEDIDTALASIGAESPWTWGGSILSIDATAAWITHVTRP